jgi:hypothetical protein
MTGQGQPDSLECLRALVDVRCLLISAQLGD